MFWMPIANFIDPAVLGVIVYGTSTINLVSAVALFYHHKYMCDRCGSDVPLDGPAEAKKYARRLSMLHFFLSRRGLLTMLVASSVTVASMIVLLQVSRPAVTVLGSLLVSMLIPYTLMINTHVRLQPWCPQCRWGKGKDGKHEPSPDPVIPEAKLLQ